MAAGFGFHASSDTRNSKQFLKRVPLKVCWYFMCDHWALVRQFGILVASVSEDPCVAQCFMHYVNECYPLSSCLISWCYSIFLCPSFNISSPNAKPSSNALAYPTEGPILALDHPPYQLQFSIYSSSCELWSTSHPVPAPGWGKRWDI